MGVANKTDSQTTKTNLRHKEQKRGLFLSYTENEWLMKAEKLEKKRIKKLKKNRN